ncbi:unnamed protein product [Lactuca virosa]|uniref:USP domain-containing protein n=1 Tax=Lactuca virosa TaxID=75947 RepID=A0AAU9NBV4_9ASTR|nr:unnamed protein product [Lactuca virosa]
MNLLNLELRHHNLELEKPELRRTYPSHSQLRSSRQAPLIESDGEGISDGDVGWNENEEEATSTSATSDRQENNHTMINGKYLSPDADKCVRNLYNLHSVLVHNGGVHGGHYYAFIRPTLSDKW